MVNPYSAGTFTLQEAPSFAWRTNGSTFSRKPRERTVANSPRRGARLGGCNVFGSLCRMEASMRHRSLARKLNRTISRFDLTLRASQPNFQCRQQCPKLPLDVTNVHGNCWKRETNQESCPINWSLGITRNFCRMHRALHIETGTKIEINRVAGLIRVGEVGQKVVRNLVVPHSRTNTRVRQ